jgi:hypothetical protein
MKEILVQKLFPAGDNAEIYQLPARREWMDETADKHAYMCFPLNITNRLGWAISFPEDIRFIWDGITDTTPDHVKIIEGEKFLSRARGNATIGFLTGLKFTTDDKTTMLTMPVPNLFVRGAQCYTTLISTSFYYHMLPIAWRLTEPNIEIYIPAGTPVATVIPISLTDLEENYLVKIDETPASEDYWKEATKYGDAAEIKNGVGDWSKMYRDAVDYRGNSVGSHETKSIKLQTIVCPVTGESRQSDLTEF